MSETRIERKKTRNSYTNGNKFKEGNPGRPKGSRDKFTSLKDAFINAFNEVGGERELVRLAKKSERNKAQFFQMITKMLPSSVDMDVKGRIEAVIVSDKFLQDVNKKDKDGAKS